MKMESQGGKQVLVNNTCIEFVTVHGCSEGYMAAYTAIQFPVSMENTPPLPLDTDFLPFGSDT